MISQGGGILAIGPLTGLSQEPDPAGVKYYTKDMLVLANGIKYSLCSTYPWGREVL